MMGMIHMDDIFMAVNCDETFTVVICRFKRILDLRQSDVVGKIILPTTSTTNYSMIL